MSDIDTMSLDELRIAVARDVMGWRDVTTRRAADGTLTGVLVTDDGRRVIDDIPDYPRDIAAHVARHLLDAGAVERRQDGRSYRYWAR